jgi:DNA gyrase subunit A
MEATIRPQNVPVYIEEEMRESFMADALSGFISRAQPHVRDGLKPVPRRVLYSH